MDDIEVCTRENVIENERNEGDEILEELDSDKIFDKLQAHIDDCGKILSRLATLIKSSSFLPG